MRPHLARLASSTVCTQLAPASGGALLNWNVGKAGGGGGGATATSSESGKKRRHSTRKRRARLVCRPIVAILLREQPKENNKQWDKQRQLQRTNKRVSRARDKHFFARAAPNLPATSFIPPLKRGREESRRRPGALSGRVLRDCHYLDKRRGSARQDKTRQRDETRQDSRKTHKLFACASPQTWRRDTPNARKRRNKLPNETIKSFCRTFACLARSTCAAPPAEGASLRKPAAALRTGSCS